MSALITADYHVPHVSNIPANRGEEVTLFVREYRKNNVPDTKPVLMLHGRSAPVVAGFDLVLPHDFGLGGSQTRYSWAQELAQNGYDVFLMDLQGNGRSPRPKMDDPCNANPAQQSVLVPNPLSALCPTPAPYPNQLGNSESEWAELDTVVKYIRALSPDRDKPIRFVGWSAGAFVMGPYTIQHPENVDSLILLAPVFPPGGRWSTHPEDPFGRPAEAQTLPVSKPAVQFGFPMNVSSKSGFKTTWDIEQGSPDQREPGMVDEVWKAVLDSDDLGAKWGRPLPDGSYEGVQRYRNTYWWGWNSQTAPIRDDSGTPVLGGRVPVLIIYGALDRQANNSPALPPVAHFSVPDLFTAIAGPQKLMFCYADAGHSMVWETEAATLHQMSQQWLKNGKVVGLTAGSYFREPDGYLTPV